MHKIRVAVLRGGPSSEYDVSLKSGAGVLSNLPVSYKGIDIFIDKKGEWHIEGAPMKAHDLVKKADVAFIALHGEFGEDGKVQKLFEDLQMPFTGSKSLASAIGMNKDLSRQVFKQHGIPVAHARVIEKNKKVSNKELAQDLWTTFTQPCVVKPNSAGSSVGVSIVHTSQELESALEKAFQFGDKIIVEEYIKGKEGTCGVLEEFRNEKLYSLLPIEIVPRKGHDFFDMEEKYSDTNFEVEICPGNFSKKESADLQKFALLAHKAIGARHYSRTDFMIHPKRGILALEINTLPGLTPDSLLPKELKAVGSSYVELLDHLIKLALKK